MSDRVIPLIDQRLQALRAVVPERLASVLSSLGVAPLISDSLGRPLSDLRISVTDKCNFRCTYCMPKEVFNKDYTYLPHSALLSFEEITRIANTFVQLGVRKIRLTGGEPLLRKNVEILISQLAALRTPQGQALDLTLTTNGSLLARKAQQLKEAGLQRVTVSLDGLDDHVFRQMNDVDFPVEEVLRGIEAAKQAGLGMDAAGHWSGLKVNMVVKRSTNVDQILPMARYFRGTGVTLRFIEYMDVGATNGWCMDEVVPSQQVIELLRQEFDLMPLQANTLGETAQRFGYTNAHGEFDPQLGEVGVISSVTQAFCSDCNRARLSTEGKLFLCLFASNGYDLRELMRDRQVNDSDLKAAIAHIWQHRQDRYSELRAQMPADQSSIAARRVEMSYIGG